MTSGLRALLGVDDRTIDGLFEHHGPLAALAGAVAGRFSAGGRDEAGRQIAASIGGLLDLDPAALLIGGWQTYGALRDAAHRTLEAPRSTEVVDLLSQEVRWESEPTIEVYLNQRLVHRLQLSLTIRFELHSLTATVRRGHLVGLRSGRCTVTAQLAWAEEVLLERAGGFEAPLVISIGSGIRLIRDTEPTASRRGER
jgi:hypothetical protein